jgi:HD-GYP domain-containing protein (c-di-GMP phosphodiesterase class II)
LARHGPRDDRFRAPLRTLDAPIRAVAAKARRPVFASSEQLDEIDAAINALLIRLDCVDPLTAEHSRAVSSWCSRLARRLSLSEREAVFVARCGMIHDVGKITTPREILFAPRALSDDEWAIMRSHTTAGERIVDEDRRLLPFRIAIRSHHERLDGRGYPDKLPAREIDLATRIVSVADSFNAMIGRRPYRAPMLPSQALEQLRANTSKQFDPEIVAAMVEVVKEV